MKPSQQIALWADKLRHMSALGLEFSRNIYDRENYQAIQDMVIEMLAMVTGDTVAALEPLRAPVISRPTPIAVGDAAIIDDDGRILLIQRADNQKWAMPGGIMDVGETPAEGVVREALEETGVHCEAVTLVGVFDSRLCGSISRHHMYQFVFLCTIQKDKPVEEPSFANEVLDIGWFAEDALPDEIDPGHVSRIPEAFRVWHGDQRSFFDQQ